MIKNYLILAVLILTLQQTNAWYDKDSIIIKNITQFSKVSISIKPDIYSGYLNVSSLEKSFFYTFVMKEGSVKTDKGIPLVLWLSGGPGCSSLISFVNQNGPFKFKDDSDEMVENQYSWHKHAHILYIQGPAGVGFSQAFIPNALNSSDTTMAQDNYLALIAFFEKFSELSPQDFYIAGQNYAGVFISRLAQYIFRKNVQDPVVKINLQGIMIGNGCIERSECSTDAFSQHQVTHLFTRGFIDQQTYQQYVSECVNVEGPNCGTLVKNIESAFEKTRLNIENIYDVCHPVGSPHSNTQNVYASYPKDVSHYLRCADKIGAETLFNDKKNQIQMHAIIQNVSNETEPISWKLCSDKINFERQGPQAYYVLYDLIKSNIRVFVYSGDFDMMVPIEGTLAWIQKMRNNYGLAIKRSWRSWTRKDKYDNDILCGMVWQLQGLTLFTVTGGGNLSMRSQPQAVNMIFKKLLALDTETKLHPTDL